jgi:tetratricopeptide (TPR) repeat protein
VRLTEGDPSLGSGLIGARPILLGGYGGLMLLRGLGRADEAATLADRLLEVAGEELVPAEQSLLFGGLAVQDAMAGRAEAARHRLQRAEAVMGEMTNPGAFVIQAMAAGMVWLRIGSLEEAARAFERVVELGLDRGRSATVGLTVLPILAGIRREQGRLAEARLALERCVEISLRFGVAIAQVLGHVGLSRVRIAEGGADAGEEALRDIEAAERSCTELGYCAGLAQVAEARADLAELAGDDGARREALEEAARLHRSCGDEVIARLIDGRLAEAR